MEGNEGSFSDQGVGGEQSTTKVATADVALAGRDQDQLGNIDNDNFIKFFNILKTRRELLPKLKNVAELYVKAKMQGKPSNDPEYTEALEELAQILYSDLAGSGKPYRAYEIENPDGTRSDVTTLQGEQLTPVTDALDRAMEVRDGEDRIKLISSLNSREIRRLKKGERYDSYQVLTDLINHTGKSADQLNTFLSSSENYRDDAANLSLTDIIDYLNQDGYFDGDELQNLLFDVYGVEMEEGKGYSTQDTRDQYFQLLDDLRQIINPFYVSGHVYDKSDNQIIRGSRFADPQVLHRLNTNMPFIQNLIDPVTGKIMRNHVLPVDEASTDASIENARADVQYLMGSPNNPLDAMPELQEEGKAAMREFAPEGSTMSLRVALNQIKRMAKNLPEIGNVARLLENKMIDLFEVEFLPWDMFRPYASPEKGVLNKAAMVVKYNKETEQFERKIVISEAFHTNGSRAAIDNLMAEIVHEAMHVITGPALDLGYAFATGKQELINKMIDQHGNPSEFNITGEALGKMWKTLNERILPYLRERAGLSDFYGLTSADEFFSEAASNPSFQEFLRNTELPQSVRGGVLRTIMDWVQSILARLGFPAAKTESAMSYAREEMDKLMRITSERSDLFNSIEEFTTLDLNISPSRLNPNRYDELLNEISRTGPSGSPTESIAETWKVFKSSLPGAEEISRGGKESKAQRSNRQAQEAARRRANPKLLEYLEENKLK